MGFFDGGFILWVFGIFCLIAILGGYLAKRAHDRRRKEMAELAASMGFDYYPDGLAKPADGFFESLLINDTTCPIIEQLSHFEPFGEGYKRSVQNLLVKQVDALAIYAMDYVYKTKEGSGKNESERTH